MSFISTELDAASLYTIRKHQDLEHIYGSAPIAVDSAGDYFLRMVRKPARVLVSGQRYLLGDQFTLPDILLFTCLRFADRMGVQRPAEFDTYYNMLAERPAFQVAERANYP
ncbi:glutathione binding-like protein [Ruegeria sp. HKCCA4707]|uniref:glutathione binding-like protein n=2 Tax=unclassified Ruegeria TaxID=2625375 RepID=UPI001488E3BE|nr:glutathione binding-like protein [Ruegeria sp. HKCCA4707]